VSQARSAINMIKFPSPICCSNSWRANLVHKRALIVRLLTLRPHLYACGHRAPLHVHLHKCIGWHAWPANSRTHYSHPHRTSDMLHKLDSRLLDGSRKTHGTVPFRWCGIVYAEPTPHQAHLSSDLRGACLGGYILQAQNPPFLATCKHGVIVAAYDPVSAHRESVRAEPCR